MKYRREDIRSLLPAALLAKRLKTLLKHPLFGALTLLGNGTIVLGASTLYYLEKNHNDHLHSFLDALWWAVATVTTVGYGEVSPQTAAGKWLGIAMMIFGTALFCSFTALFASILLRPEIEGVEAELKEVESSVSRLRSEVSSDEEELARIAGHLETTLESLRQLAARNRLR
jgi:voltage-gated potassium channel Kch